MITKTIAELWNGTLNPCQNSEQKCLETESLKSLIHRNLDQLEETMDNNQKLIFENYNLCINEYLSVSCEQAFCNGFSTGSKLLAEALLADG